MPRIAVQDLKYDAIQMFKDKAVARGRLTQEEISVSNIWFIKMRLERYF